MHLVIGTRNGQGAAPGGRTFGFLFSLLLCVCAAQFSCSHTTGVERPVPEPVPPAVTPPRPLSVHASPPEDVPVHRHPPVFDEQLAALAENISMQMPREATIRMAVLPFSDIDGRVTECGKLLARDLEAELVRQGRERGTFWVVERELLPMILREVKHGMSGLVDEAWSAQAGRQLGATSLLVAAVNPWNEGQIRVTGKVMDTETTRILAAFSTDITLPPGMLYPCSLHAAPPPASFELVLAENPDSAYRIRVWTDKAVYRLGDPVRVFVQSDRGGYLVLFDIDSQGNQTLLLPNLYAREPRLLGAGEVFQSPAGWFVAGRPTGRGYLKAVVTPTPLPLEATRFTEQAQGSPFRSLNQANTRGVVVSTKQSHGGFGTAWITIEE